ncbi:MAG: NEW3 domain-containing protein [Chloroflexota bacterium]
MRVLRAAAAALLLALTVAPAAALAQGPLELTTPYPAVVVDPGATAKFPVFVITEVAERVDLTIVSQPEGWDVVLRGGGSTVSAIFTAPNPDVTGEISGSLEANVTLPDDAAPGSNQVVIEGRTASGITTRLTLDITVEEQEPGSVDFTADFPTLRGSTSSPFSYNLTLANHTNQQVIFGFETDAPVGWDVTAQPSGESQASTATVDAGSIATVSVNVDPPADAVADTYPIIVRAVGGPVPAEAALSVEIVGSYALSLGTSDGLLNARVTAGATSVLTLVIENNGTAPLTNVKMAATPPRNWKITFDLETVPEIPAGSTGNTATVQATIEAPANAVAGDYQLTIRATSQEESSASDNVEIRATVDTSPTGYLIGIAVLVAVAVGLFFVFQRYGRR